MTPFQKVIKYFAIALALCIVVGIFGGILRIAGIFSFFSGNSAVLDDVKTYSVSQDITSIDIDISAADFKITSDSVFSVESNLEYLTVEENGRTLVIKETKKFKTNYSDAVLNIYIPDGTVFENAEITTGAGIVSIDVLSAESLKLELGAGAVRIAELNASSKAEISGGAGEVNISGGTLYNIDLDMGVGELNLTAALLGESELNYGVGEANVVLVGTKDDYIIEIDKGLGDVTVDGSEMRDGSVYGSGDNEIDISGGVGAVKVSFKERAV